MITVWLTVASVIFVISLVAVLPTSGSMWKTSVLLSALFGLIWPIIICVFIIGFILSSVFLSTIIREGK